MQNEIFHFKVGAFDCTAVSDGTFTYGPPMFPPAPVFLFSNAAKEPLEQTLGEHDLPPETWTEWISPFICLVVNTGKELVLVDTGASKLAPQTGGLLERLQGEGIGLGDIHRIIITHGHADHIAGITLDDGSLAFPNAQYAMQKKEWDFWTTGEAEEKFDGHTREILVGTARKNLPPIREKVDLIKGESDILPGIRAVPAPGHTPGHMALSISSQGEQLLYISDTVLHPIHLEHPEWNAVVDLEPEQAVASRRHILDLAGTENTLVLAFHFPFPGLGYIQRKGEAWTWQPYER
jgi:glyoxylase-like metal-dependent hydrolase (beta-lactamase superfamily II)